MALETFLARIRNGEAVAFDDTLRVIAEHYDYQPSAFQNGTVDNAAGQNEGSCRVFAFARLHGLSAEQTLALFGEHYRDTLADPQGTSHANIRAFMRGGWEGIAFAGTPLTAKA
jgi:hypothetical protein